MITDTYGNKMKCYSFALVVFLMISRLYAEEATKAPVPGKKVYLGTPSKPKAKLRPVQVGGDASAITAPTVIQKPAASSVPTPTPAPTATPTPLPATKDEES
jgi:hypothetical protein